MDLDLNFFGSVRVYRIKETIYTIPTLSEAIGISGLTINPIRQVNLKDGPIELINTILETRSDCEIGEHDFSRNSFKQFLKLSKVRSEKKLNQNSKCISVIFTKENIILKNFFYDENIKAMFSKDEDDILLAIGMDKKEFGEKILSLLNSTNVI